VPGGSTETAVTADAYMPAGVPTDLQRAIDAWPALPTIVRQDLLAIIDDAIARHSDEPQG